MWESFAWGLVGGVLAELLALFRTRQELAVAVPAWLRSPVYWVLTTLMILAGGLMVLVYVRSGFDMKPILAVNIGASAPLIIGNLIVPPKGPERVG